MDGLNILYRLAYIQIMLGSNNNYLCQKGTNERQSNDYCWFRARSGLLQSVSDYSKADGVDFYFYLDVEVTL